MRNLQQAIQAKIKLWDFSHPSPLCACSTHEVQKISWSDMKFHRVFSQKGSFETMQFWIWWSNLFCVSGSINSKWGRNPLNTGLIVRSNLSSRLSALDIYHQLQSLCQHHTIIIHECSIFFIFNWTTYTYRGWKLLIPASAQPGYRMWDETESWKFHPPQVPV